MLLREATSNCRSDNVSLAARSCHQRPADVRWWVWLTSFVSRYLDFKRSIIPIYDSLAESMIGRFVDWSAVRLPACGGSYESANSSTVISTDPLLLKYMNQTSLAKHDSFPSRRARNPRRPARPADPPHLSI